MSIEKYVMAQLTAGSAQDATFAGPEAWMLVEEVPCSLSGRSRYPMENLLIEFKMLMILWGGG